MDFRLLGALAVRANGSYIAIDSSRHRRLLAALLINDNKPVSLDRMTDVIWGEAPPTTARQQVQNCVGSLRRRLAGADQTVNITRHGTAYVLEISDDVVDARVFERLFDQGIRFIRQGNFRQATDALRAGLELWQGRALQDVGSEALIADAVHLEETRLRALKALVDLEFSQGNKISMIGELRAWSLTYPYHEELHCRLAEALEAASRKAEALHVLQALKERLHHELNVDVGASTHELERHLLIRDVNRSPLADTFTVSGTTETKASDLTFDLQTLQAISSALGELSSTLRLLLANQPRASR